MNTQLLVLVLLKCWFFNEFIARSTVTSEVKFDAHSSNHKNRAYARKFLSKEQQYLYLNYKEAYGLRFDPKKIHKRQPISNESSTESSWNNGANGGEVDVTTIGFGDIQTVSISPENGSIETTTISSPSSSVISLTTTITNTDDDRVSPTPSTAPNKQQKVLAFSALLNRLNASKRQNTTDNTTFQQPARPSTLRETLNLIRKRLKQWLSFGSDPKASLINGQRFLNVFNVIKFENSPCTSTQEGLSEMSGICYHDYQCAQWRGSSIGECADGLGVCCVCKNFDFEKSALFIKLQKTMSIKISFRSSHILLVKSTCGQSSNQPDSYFQNPGWPEASQDRLICTVTIELQEDVAQVRLDFVSFEVKISYVVKM